MPKEILEAFEIDSAEKFSIDPGDLGILITGCEKRPLALIFDRIWR